MPDPSAHPCVLVVADTEKEGELVGALSEPLPTTLVSRIEVLAGQGGDETIEMFEDKKPHVVVVTASLEAGDTKALVEAMRGMMPPRQLAVVVIGDPEGPIKNALDAADLAPDRFVSRPLSARALRFAVASGIEAVTQARAPQAVPVAPASTPSAPTMPASHNTQPGLGLARPPAVVLDDPARAAMRARWAAIADSIIDVGDEIGDQDREPPAQGPGGTEEDAAPLPPPFVIKPRRRTEGDEDGAPPDVWKPGTTDELAPEPPQREPTLIIRDPDPQIARTTSVDSVIPTLPRTQTPDPPPSRTKTGDDKVDLAEHKPGEQWSEPLPLAELIDRDSKRDLSHAAAMAADMGPLEDYDDDLVIDDAKRHHLEGKLEVLDDLPDSAPDARSTGDGRDFARQLRAKMSMMAQRLFQGAEAGAPAAADLAPRHDHSTEIDLSSLGDETPLGAGVTEIESRSGARSSPDISTSPGSWDTQVRERGLPDSGELVRGVSDAPMLLAKMFAGLATARIGFRKDQLEIVVYFDQGRPVFASSSDASDRMGELLVREGKITAAQYERCQTVVAESGRRMGEILVDFGYLKRRELLPAVRRHVEDIVYSLFGWDRGHYHITLEAQPSAERIRLSRHPAALILEGIRRKLGRTSLERLIGPASTVIEVADRDRLGGIINTGDLAAEERVVLSAFDGQSDLAAVARTAGVDVADLLPLAWGLCVLGLATARRTDTEVPDESTALVGETDLAIDRERVRARWQLVTESDYFALLGVRRDATGFEIRRAYQSARRDFSADGFPTDLRRELAQELDDIANVLDEAFRVLRDDRLRQTYLANLIE